MRSFSTDWQYQGQGYAKKALLLLDKYIKVHFPKIDEIVLAVNSVNLAAICLYSACGYKETKKRIQTEYGQLWILSKSVA
ncbi:GNAT family N-acetyltransferase [Enterococcus sp. LJL51]|uniref:GNAT family N-acetyltransferase n=1 Tax=Enterococcus sp. LJL51 TaxID=3416656 RepID=UPI003CF0601B